MLLTVSLLGKASLLGSLINKCRQVVRFKKVKPIETNVKPNISTSPNVDMPPFSSVVVNIPVPDTNRPSSVANISLSASATAVVRTMEAQVGLPPKPKKPLTPYFRYMQEHRPKLQASNPKMHIIEIVRKLSKQWQNAEPSLKHRLQVEYKKEQHQYLEEILKYNAKITEEQTNQLKELRRERADAKGRRIMRKRIKELGRPKRPASAFLRYLSKERQASPHDNKQTFRSWVKQIAEKWTRLSDEEKNAYMQECRKDMVKYKEDMTVWEEKMIRLGNIDVVRNNLLDGDVKTKKL